MMWDFGGGGYNNAPPYSYPDSEYQPYPPPTMDPIPPFPLPGPSPPPAPFMPIGIQSLPTAVSLFPSPSYGSYTPSYPPQPVSPITPVSPVAGAFPSYHGYGFQTVPPPRPSPKPHKSRPNPPPVAPQAPSAPVASTSHAAHHEPQQETFQYSRCTGKKKALCIGINYTGQSNQLSGCVNDARTVQRWLTRYHHFNEEDIVLLTDDTPNPRQQPTRANILDAMKWLVKGARTHDSLFLHYSGHGGQIRDLDGDETDGLDEVIFPLDYLRNGFIVDDQMHKILVKPLPTGCRLTALFDSCHSGSILDLPYLYHTNGRVKGSQVSSKHRKSKSTTADVISFSGCKDYQTSADTYEGGAAVGAMSHAFISSLKNTPRQSYQDLLRSVREVLRKKYSQKPQLSSSHKIDTRLQFII